jgi:metallo-beta-lactamase family protein
LKLTFLGATRTVTGSSYRLQMRTGAQVLVDCGLFQGLKELRLKNWEKLPIDLTKLKAIVLTHAHLDHSGLIPALIRQGFTGPIYATPATIALCKILLPDSGRLQEEEANYANQKGFSKHHPARPLYTLADAERSLEHFQAKEFGEEFQVTEGLNAVFEAAGHILGAAWVRLQGDATSILFSGDLGRKEDPLMRPPKPRMPADYLVVESTYGDRLHHVDVPEEQKIREWVLDAWKRNAVIIIPAFSVGRTQGILYLLWKLKRSNSIPDIPIFLNSPMSLRATSLYQEYAQEHRLTVADCLQMCKTARPVHTIEESKELNDRAGPMIIISASGMATGGRVLHHLKRFAPDPANRIILAGFQAAGTRGDSLARGAKAIKIHGDFVSVHAKVEVLRSLSAHADANEIVRWLHSSTESPIRTFITHGEASASEALKAKIESELGWPQVHVPTLGEEVELPGKGTL